MRHITAAPPSPLSTIASSRPRIWIGTRPIHSLTSQRHSRSRQQAIRRTARRHSRGTGFHISTSIQPTATKPIATSAPFSTGIKSSFKSGSIFPHHITNLTPRQPTLLDPATGKLQEEVTTFALGLTAQQQSMLRFWSAKLAADDELDHIFAAITRKAGWND